MENMLKDLGPDYERMDWMHLPLPESVKDLLLGKSVFTKADKEIMNLKEGYYTIQGTTNKLAREGIDLLKNEIKVNILDKKGSSVYVFDLSE